jgi:hypothetical protein
MPAIKDQHHHLPLDMQKKRDSAPSAHRASLHNTTNALTIAATLRSFVRSF